MQDTPIVRLESNVEEQQNERRIRIMRERLEELRKTGADPASFCGTYQVNPSRD